MSGAIPREHWFDRLAVPQTRTQVLKAALAGAALTLPFARSAPAHATSTKSGTRSAANPCNAKPSNNPKACQKGCLRTARFQTLRRMDACDHNAALGLAIAEYAAPVLGFLALSTSVFVNGIGTYTCSQLALMRDKAMMFDCLQPNCPGFDPCGPDGPCEDCARVPGASCCPSTDVFGYRCCAQCCAKNGDGCGSGVTECGGGTAP